MNDTIDALESLLSSPGWRAFVAYVGTEWGPKGYAGKIKAAVQEARSNGTDAADAVLFVDRVNDAVSDIMRWPADELGRQRRLDRGSEVTMSRRGGL